MKINQLYRWKRHPEEVFKIIGISDGKFKYKYVKTKTHRDNPEQTFTTTIEGSFGDIQLLSKLDKILE